MRQFRWARTAKASSILNFAPIVLGQPGEKLRISWTLGRQQGDCSKICVEGRSNLTNACHIIRATWVSDWDVAQSVERLVFHYRLNFAEEVPSTKDCISIPASCPREIYAKAPRRLAPLIPVEFIREYSLLHPIQRGKHHGRSL
jgi:hypothetical protein